ncbi:MAG TPA: beta-propeller fold lactonase family protein [Solirubrobacteraceae bacterium]|nr:beta-propeller fold lactonase family protein [Solirubrobacteraceae bacterium]
MRKVPRRVERAALWAGTVGLAALGAAAVPSVAAAATGHPSFGGPHGSPTVGQVYLDANTPRTNTVAAFDRHADGSLTPTPGSPFQVGGAGTGTGLPSEGAVQLAANGHLLLSADPASNQVSVEYVHPDGTLSPVSGSPFSSNGVEPDSIAVHGDLVYVANEGNGGPGNYTGFRLGFAGRLIPVPSSTVTLPAGADPGEIIFNPAGDRLVASEVGTSLIDSFQVGLDGRLYAAPGSPYPAQALGPFGAEFRPTNPYQLFVSNAHQGAGLGSVSVFNDGFGGRLSPLTNSPFANGQSGTCWVTISPDGRTLFAVNTGSGTISKYAIAPSGNLTLLSNTTVSSQAGVGATDPATSPDGQVLYVNESRTGTVAAFATNGSGVTELPGSPVSLPNGTTGAAGITVR